SISVSTAFGAVGGKLSGTFDSTGTFNNGSSGTVSFGILPSSPAAASVAAVFLTSATWGWSGATVDWGDAPPSSRRFRVHAATASAPLDWAEVTASSGASTGTETDLLPNTTYSRVITAFTEWGDSIASAEVATCTLASVPGPPAGVSTFTNVQERQLTFNWGAGSPANPSVTTYEVWRSTVSDFGSAVHSSLEAQVSTTPVNLAPETVYYFRVRAQSLYGALTDFTTTFAIATSTTVPQAPGSPRPDSPFSYDGTATFRWAAAFSPSGIREYFLEIGSFPGGADFLSRSVGNVTTYQASGLSSKKTYYGRVRAVSNAEVTSSFSDAGPPVSVFLSAQEPAVAKPRGYPNPFDPTEGPAQVAFSLAEPAAVTLKLYTLQGLLVYQETRAFGAGNQVFPWNGASGSGVRVAAGGYIGVIEKGYAAGKETQRFKLAVVH
ncbi:MAG: fibronectin type III domain-containing protein, partial [Elusimicrobia bacterium]|nr:fibronectin type III domain-containing protein [Elusimicrobiota bacterium]